MTPEMPCSQCGSARFAFFRKLRLEAAVLPVSSIERRAPLSLLMCIGCGKVELFADRPDELLRAFVHDEVEARSGGPYR